MPSSYVIGFTAHSLTETDNAAADPGACLCRMESVVLLFLILHPILGFSSIVFKHIDGKERAHSTSPLSAGV